MNKRKKADFVNSLSSLIGVLYANNMIIDESIIDTNYNINDINSLTELFDKYVAPVWIGIYQRSPENMLSYIRAEREKTIRDIEELLCFDDDVLALIIGHIALVCTQSINNNRQFLNTLLLCIKKYHRSEFGETR